MQTISIIINNYNYGRFLRQCIESALNQTVSADEIIVVDDGSKDNSLETLSSYENLVVVIRKDNGGQASAINAGFYASRGSWVLFLDADDWLEPDCIEELHKNTSNDFTKIHFPLTTLLDGTTALGQIPTTAEGLSNGRIIDLPGAMSYSTPPTSGNLFRRTFIESILPIPENKYRICADVFLLFSKIQEQNIYAINKTLGNYRIHRSNNWYRASNLNPSTKLVKSHLAGMTHRLKLIFDQFHEDTDLNFRLYLERHLDHHQCKLIIFGLRLALELENPFPKEKNFYEKVFKKCCKTLRGRKLLRQRLELILIYHAPRSLLIILSKAEVSIRTYRRHLNKRRAF